MVPKEKIIAARIGTQSDTYLMYAIRQKRLDILLFLLREVPELDLLTKNSQGMTALHMAIRSNNQKMVKALVLKDHKKEQEVEEVLKTFKIEDIKTNLTPKVIKMLQLQNSKGMTPLISSVDHGNYAIFRFIIELIVYI